MSFITRGGGIDSYVKKYQRLASLAVAGLFMFAQLAVLVQPVSAIGGPPVDVGNQGQGDTQKNQVADWCEADEEGGYFGVKFDSGQVSVGEHIIDPITMEITKSEEGADGKTEVDSVTGDGVVVTKVIVNGGSSDNVYEPPFDYPLVAPTNEGGQQADVSHVIVCYEEEDSGGEIDYCDPTQKPGGMSIAQWLEANDVDGSDCFEYEVIQECGSLDVAFTKNETPYNYSFRYALGDETPTLENWEGTGPLPVNFDEDENGGSVELTYYVVGPEGDYFEGFGMPNIWDGNGVTVVIDTDCEEPDSVTVVAQKIVCEDEALLPNGIDGSISEGFAADWVEENEGCELEDDWSFEWSTEGVIGPDDNPANDLIGPAGEPWNTFTADGDKAEVNILIDDISSIDKHGNKIIELREVLEEGYIPFTGLGGDDESAEFYCHDDVNGFDNIEWIKNPEDGETYYCVAWNAEVEDDGGDGGDDGGDQGGDDDEKDEDKDDDKDEKEDDENGQVLGDDDEKPEKEAEVLAVTGNNIWLGTLLGTLIVALSASMGQRPLMQTVAARFKK